MRIHVLLIAIGVSVSTACLAQDNNQSERELQMTQAEQELVLSDQEEYKLLRRLHEEYYLAIILEELQFKFKEAAERSRKALRTFPDDPVFLLELAVSLSASDDFIGAESAYSQLVSIQEKCHDPDLARTLRSYRKHLLREAAAVSSYVQEKGRDPNLAKLLKSYRKHLVREAAAVSKRIKGLRVKNQ